MRSPCRRMRREAESRAMNLAPSCASSLSARSSIPLLQSSSQVVCRCCDLTAPMSFFELSNSPVGFTLAFIARRAYPSGTESTVAARRRLHPTARTALGALHYSVVPIWPDNGWTRRRGTAARGGEEFLEDERARDRQGSRRRRRAGTSAARSGRRSRTRRGTVQVADPRTLALRSYRTLRSFNAESEIRRYDRRQPEETR